MSGSAPLRITLWSAIALLAALTALRPAPPVEGGKALSPWRAVIERLREDRASRIAIAFLTALALATLLSAWLAPFPPNDLLEPELLRGRSPSWLHLFGTDRASRDVFSRMLVGARISLGIALLAILLAATVGTCWGAIAGYYGGVVDSVMMRLVDTALAIPRVLLLLAILSLWGALTIPELVILLGATGWFDVSRLVRAEVLSAREREMVLAARALGAGNGRILWRHVLPNAISPAIVAAALGIGNVLILEAGLSFLGMGVQPPDPSWGTMIGEGSSQLSALWWVSVFPGLAIVLTALSFNTLGDGLRDALDPRQLPRR
ncbi:MAG: ABC transporter permease [Gemmatimonadota bacterium]|nr:ABC transporter permease [Gemmatimonadota bacterium]